LLPTEDITLITAFLLTIAALSAAETQVMQEIICAETAFSRAAEIRDQALFLSFVDPEARFVSDHVARGRSEIGAAWAIFFQADGPQIRWRPRVVAVSSDGRLALSRGPYRTVRIDENGARIESWGTFISTWRLGSDGKWKVLFDTGTNVGMTPGDDDHDVLEREPECP
jgi:ketosteroid isomerase-like protein